MSLRCRVVAAALALLVLPGCVSTAATQPVMSSGRSVSSSSRVPVCTPLPTLGPPQGSPTPCSSEEASANAATVALEQEAIRVYDRYAAEYIRLLYEGGATEPTPVLVETTDGTFQEHMMGPLGYYKGKGLSVKGPTPRFRAAVDRTARYIDTEVTLLACEDATGSAMYNPDGSKFHDGELHVYQMLLARRDGRLKIFTNSRQEVSSCPLG